MEWNGKEMKGDGKEKIGDRFVRNYDIDYIQEEFLTFLI